LKLNIDIVWHEFGHLFSYKLVEKLGGKPRIILGYNLVKSTESTDRPSIKTDYKEFTKGKDELFKEYQLRIRAAFHSNSIYYHFIVLLMGAIFQLENSKFPKTIENLRELFEDGVKVSDDSLRGHAGSDFTKIKLLLMDNEDGNLMSTDIISFAHKLHEILKEHEIFSKSSKIVDKLNLKYNGTQKKVCNPLLENEMEEIENIIDPNLLDRVDKEINILKERNQT